MDQAKTKMEGTNSQVKWIYKAERLPSFEGEEMIQGIKILGN